MADSVFLALFHMSLVGTVVGLAVLLLKVILQKSKVPPTVLIWLWLVVVFRLLCPIAADSKFSAFNALEGNSEITLAIKPLEQVIYSKTEEVPEQSTPDILTVLWVTGVVLMVGKGVFDYWRLKRKLRFAVKKDGYFSADVSVPFVFGILKPKIFIPHCESETFIPHILCHEKAHIKRYDHVLKLFAYIVLAIHWFNPAVWIFYRIYEADLEHACDYCATKGLSSDAKKAYLTALVSSANKKIPKAITPVCFGGCSVKKRVLLLLNAKRSKLMTAIGVVMVLIVSVTLGTNAVPTVIGMPQPESFLMKAVSLQNEAELTDVPAKDKTKTVESEAKQKNANQETGVSVQAQETVARTAEFSYENDCISVMDNVEANANGEITMQFDLNAQQFIQISFYESASGTEIEGMGIVAETGKEYVFSGFETDKKYTLKVNGYTQDTWMVEGTYSVY